MICGEERMLEDLRLGCKALELIRHMVELDDVCRIAEDVACCAGEVQEALNDMRALLEVTKR